MQRIALIAAYEPDKKVRDIVKALFEENFVIVVVDDGSGSAYKSTFLSLEPYAKIISYEKNQGKGHALKTGLQYIADNYKCGTVVTLDADGQHLITDAVKVCEASEINPESLVIGSRVISKEDPVKSRLGNEITRKVYNLVTGVKVYDTQSGLRAFQVQMVPELLNIEGNRYEYEMNVLLQLAHEEIPIKEIPIKTIYFDRKNSVSHFNAWKDSFKIYREILKFACSSFASFIVDYILYSFIIALMGTSELTLLFANFGARAVSSVFNFTLNKKMVFKSTGHTAAESSRYFALVLFNICVNTLILTWITHLGINAFAAKIIVEMTMFIISYTAQHFLIFKRIEKVQP